MDESTTMFGAIVLHVSRHAYKRGRFVGEAPADPKRRARTKERARVAPDGTAAYLRFHRTDVITAYPDGAYKLNTGGWDSSPTTRAAINDALRRFAPTYNYLTTLTKFGVSQVVVNTPEGYTPYYDGMSFNPDGTLHTLPRPFKAKRINPDEAAAFSAAIKDNGFKDMFPLLWSTVGVEEFERYTPLYITLENRLREDDVEDWRRVIGRYKYEDGWAMKDGRFQRVLEEKSRKETWTRLMRDVKQRMYETVNTNVFFV